MATQTHQIHVWISPELHRVLAQRAAEHGTSISREVRQVVETQLSDPETGEGTRVTARLIQSAIEQRQWNQVLLTKLLDLLGEHDPTAQDARVVKVRDQITAYATAHTQAFFDEQGR